MKKIDKPYIVLFIFLALGLSFPIQLGYLDEFFEAFTANTFLVGSSYLMSGISILIASTVVFILHKNLSRRITILGEDKLKNALILSLPVVVLTFIGLKNNLGMHKSLYGFTIASVNTIYAFTEELGWRRYLQNSMEGINQKLKYVLISLVWWIWHFRFETQFDLFIFPLICIGGGFLLGKLADESKSILPVVAMHTLIIVTTNSGRFDVTNALVIGVVIMTWFAIEVIWKRRNPKPPGRSL